MNEQMEQMILRATGATGVQQGEVIQSLWSGYGEIVRCFLRGTDRQSVVLKHVKFPSEVNHPRGWHNDLSHQRKVHSYEVEMNWYGDWANQCDDACRVPHCFASQTIGEEHVIVLEDLDAAGYPRRRANLDVDGVKQCLSWLAHFHARFMGEDPSGLWHTGTYWHLATRPDELQVMHDEDLRDAAPILDSMLSCARYQTLVHGDAKVANFCFGEEKSAVAAVDFQYVGGGCGMKDVAYFLGSCLSDRDQQRLEQELLDFYFIQLKAALQSVRSDVDAVAVEQEWRALFAIAQADFYRFLVGWMPTHWKINDYNRRVTQQVLSQL